MTGDDREYTLSDLLVAFQQRDLAHDFYRDRYQALARAFELDLEHPPPDNLISPPGWLIAAPERFLVVNFGESKASDLIVRQDLRAPQLWELFLRLADKRLDLSGVGGLDFGEETSGEQAAPRVEMLFDYQYQRVVEHAFAHVREARASFLVETICAMWHVAPNATVKESELGRAGFDVRAREEPDIWEIS